MDVIFDPTRQTAPGGGAAPEGGGDIIKDGDQRTFMQDVIQASREVPVLVDFWATWCGPCKTLTPTLEKVVRAAQGRVRLVKIDIDKNRALVQQLAQMGLPLQSVPTVVGFVQGQIADLFQGALPEGEVKKFIENLLKMAGGQLPGADLLAEAKAAAEQGDHQAALELFAALAAGRAREPRRLRRPRAQPDGARRGGAGAAGARAGAGQDEGPCRDRLGPLRAAARDRGPRRAREARRVRDAASPPTRTTTPRASTSPSR